MTLKTPYNVKQGEVAQTKLNVRSVTSTSTIHVEPSDCIVLNSASDITATVANAPEAGDVIYIFCQQTDANSTVTLPTGVTWNGSNRSAVFGDAGDALIAVAVSATRYLVLVNTGSVTFSS